MIHSQSQAELLRENTELQERLAQCNLVMVCGHSQNFIIGDEHGHFTCTVCANDELTASNAQMREALGTVVALDFKKLESGSRDLYSGAPKFVEAWLICDKAMAETPAESLAAIQDAARAKEREQSKRREEELREELEGKQTAIEIYKSTAKRRGIERDQLTARVRMLEQELQREKEFHIWASAEMEEDQREAKQCAERVKTLEDAGKELLAVAKATGLPRFQYAVSRYEQTIAAKEPK